MLLNVYWSKIMTTFLLVDNGSIKAAATLQLRRIAQQLSECSGKHVYPVSLQHAGRIPKEALEGIRAAVFTDFLRQKLTAGERHFRVLPLFFGHSRALSAFIPEQQALLEQDFGCFTLTLADVLYPLPEGNKCLVDIIYDHIQQTAIKASLPLKNIVLVDHGSPSPQVTEVRNEVRNQVHTQLKQIIPSIDLSSAAMERRAGRCYDFNGILLVDWLRKKAEQGESSAVVALLFSLPGKHAGDGGDIVTICESVMHCYPAFKIAITPLVGEHPLLLKILQERLVYG